MLLNLNSFIHPKYLQKPCWTSFPFLYQKPKETKLVNGHVTSRLLRLPNEIIEHIFKFLEPSDVETLKFVCKKFKNIYEQRRKELPQEHIRLITCQFGEWHDVLRERCKVRESSYASVITLLKLENDQLSISKELIHKIGRPVQNSPSSIAWSPLRDRILGCTTPSGNALVWDLNNTANPYGIFQCGSSYPKIKFHNFDENIMGLGSSDSYLALYDIRISTRASTIFSGISSVRDIDFSHHSDTQNIIVAVGDSGTVKFFDFRKPNKPFRDLLAHQGQIMSVIFNKKEKNLIATGGRDKLIKIWDWSKDGSNLYSIEAPSPVGKIVWTNENPWQVCSIPATMASKDIGDFSTYIWDFRRPYIPYKHFRRHDDFITDVTFPLDPQVGTFCTCDDSGKIGYHKLSKIGMPIKKVDMTSVANSKADNEAAVVIPMNTLHLDEKYHESPSNFGTQVKSHVYFISTGNENSESGRFKHFARNYKLFSLKNESVLDLCTHNSNVAFAIGDIELARSWNMLGVAANNDVISSVRTGLGYQIRPPTDESSPAFSFMDEISEPVEEIVEASEEKETSPNDDVVNVCEPSREFCYDQELLDFSGVLEEDLDYHYSDEFISGRLSKSRRRKFRPRLQIPKREEWYTGGSTCSNDFIPQPPKAFAHKIHRFGSDRYPLPAFRNTPAGLIRRTCVSFVFDHSKYAVKEQQIGRKAHSHTLEKWIENNRILQSPRAPLNELQRIIIERATDYYHQEMTKEKSWSNEKAGKPDPGFKSVFQSNPWKIIKFLFDYYMALDDVQTCACMAMCVGEKITMLISEESVDRWFFYYVDLLEQHSLFKEATAFMKASFRIQVAQMNIQGNFVYNTCTDCKNDQILDGPVCKYCSTEHFCLICENLVHSSWLICTECGHGGHPDHINQWFAENNQCPAINCEHNCFPQLRIDPIEARLRAYSNNGLITSKKLRASNNQFWTYKIPP
ncbi:hypothetical protein FO519_003563 [Halicephalobus sp. NKZ332]|nr:hypothetical protein FO519_003563 [Halicephalobus sp. NKZ332]